MQLEEMVRKIAEEEARKVKIEILAEFKANSPILDIQEASEFLGISKSILYDMCKRKLIPHLRFGAEGSQKPKIKFRLIDLKDWFEEQTQKNYKKVN